MAEQAHSPNGEFRIGFPYRQVVTLGRWHTRGGEGGYQNDVGAWFIARPSDQLSRVAWNVPGFFFFGQATWHVGS